MIASQRRAELWKGLSQETHLIFIDDALDRNDADHESLRQELKAIRTLLIGILISTATASILLALNLVVQKA